MKKLAIITTHPIQYNAPLFKLLQDRKQVEIKVFYTWGEDVLVNKYDPGFKRVITWDIPLLNGYNYSFVENTAKDPGSHHFNGIVNPRLINAIEDWGANVLLIFGWSFKSHLALMRHFKNKIGIIFRGDSNLLDEPKRFSFKKIARRIFLSWVYSHVDAALYVGEANRNYFEAHGMKPGKLVFGPHAVDNERFNDTLHKDLREELNIPSQAIVFLITGKLEQKKNPAMALRIFARIDNSSIYLLIVGSGILEDEIKAMINGMENTIKQRIRVLPFQNQQRMPAVYKTADILIMPSQGPGETWGLVVNEAMACGLPVIVSNKCGCASSLVHNGETGYIFEFNNDEDLLLKMGIMLENKEKLISMGKNAKALIQTWSFENLAIAIEGTVNKM